MRYLVTGHKGFIGSHVFHRLHDHPVSPGQVVEGVDLQEGNDFVDIKGQTYDAVIHCAAFVSVTESEANPEKYYKNNYKNVEEFLRANTVGKFIFLSTGGALYGDKVMAKENDAKMENCTSHYAKSKLMAEEAVAKLSENHLILRLSNVIGEGEDDRGEANVMTHFRRDNPIVLYGGEQKRDFVSVDAVVEAIIRGMTRGVRGIFNIGSGQMVPISDLAIKAARERHVPIVVEDYRPGEVMAISLDCRKAIEAGLIDA